MRKFCCSMLWLLCVVTIASGCRSSSKPPESDYQTVGKDPRRDIDMAKRENAKAVELIAAGKYNEAEKVLRSALAADVTYGPAHNNLGQVYYHQGKLYLAAWEFQYATKLMPGQPEPRSNLGLVFENVGKLDDAVGWYDQAVGLSPDDPQYLGNLARARVKRGDKTPDVRDLLNKLVMRDTRPDWLEWARERLALMPKAATNETATP